MHGTWVAVYVGSVCVATFLAVAAIQAYACYEWMPHADVRGGFVVATTWLAGLATIDASR